jgi:Tol biopolymer transport system component
MKYLWLMLCILCVGAASAQAQETKSPVYYYNASWSPDGSKILFESNRDGKLAIYTIQADGNGLRKLTSGEVNDEQPCWSADGRQIAFASMRDGHLQLYIMDADGSHQRRLTNAKDIDYTPAFSPKGDEVAFNSRAEGASVVHDIYVVRTDGTARKRLTDQSANDMSPVYSPNGKKILFVRSVIIKRYYNEMSKAERERMKQSEEVFVMNKDGSKVKNLTNNSARDCCAYWSSNGKTIYFLSEREGSPNIYAMNADGSKVRKVADGSIVSNPVVSRDGKYFVYTKKARGQWGVYVYDIAGKEERLLISD